MSRHQGGHEIARHRCLDTPPARDHHEVGLGQDLEPVFDRHREAACRPQRPGLNAADRVAVPAGPDLRARQAEDLGGRAELEGTKPVIGQDGDAGTR